LPPDFGNYLIATFYPVDVSMANQTIAIPPFPNKLNFLNPCGHLFPNFYFSSSVRTTTFFADYASADYVLKLFFGLKSYYPEVPYALIFFLVTILSL
jgi:hypothetical protein